MKECVIRLMATHGYTYDDLESHAGYWHFFGDFGASIYFATWRECYTWAKEVIAD